MTKTTDLAGNIVKIVQLVNSGDTNLGNYQKKITQIPEADPKVTDVLAFYDKDSDTESTASIADILKFASANPLPNAHVSYENLDDALQREVALVRNENLANGNFRYDTNNDGLADFWNISETGASRNVDVSINSHMGAGFLQSTQSLSVDNVGTAVNDRVRLYQLFPRDFEGKALIVNAHIWTSGNTPMPIAVSIYWQETIAGNKTYSASIQYAPGTLSSDSSVQVTADTIPPHAAFIGIEFAMEGGPGGDQGPHGFTVGEVALHFGAMPESADNTVNVITRNALYHNIGTLEFVGGKGDISPDDNTRLKVTSLSYNFEGADKKIYVSRGDEIVMPTTSISYLDPDSPDSAMVVVPQVTLLDKEDNAVDASQFKFDSNFSIEQGQGDESGVGLVKLKSSHVRGSAFLAAANKQLLITAADRAEKARSAIWLGDPIEFSSDEDGYDAATKSFILTPKSTGAPNYYLVAFVVNIAGPIIETGFVRAFLRDPYAIKEDEYLTDVNGELFVVQQNYALNDPVKEMIFAGIVEARSPRNISFHIVKSFTDSIRLADPLDAPTALLIQQVDAAIDLLPKFENMTGANIRWTVENFKNPIASMVPMLGSDLPLEEYAVPAHPGDNVFAEDGYVLLPVLNKTRMAISGKVLILEDDAASNAPYFSFGYYFGEMEMSFLRGNSLTAHLELKPNDYAGTLMLVSWNGSGEVSKADNAVVGYDNGEPRLGNNWTIVKREPVASLATVCDLVTTIPDDARIAGVLFVPARAIKPMVYMITELNIRIDPEVSGAIIHYVRSKDEIEFQIKNQYERFIKVPLLNATGRYTINKTESPCPVGVAKSPWPNMPITLNTNVNQVPGSQIPDGEGGLQFNQDLDDVVINTSVRLYPGEALPVGDTAAVTFTWYTVTDDGSLTLVPGGEQTVSIPHGSPPTFEDFSLTGSFKRNDTIVLKMKTTGDDYAFIQSSSQHIPMVENVITLTNITAAGN